jgi:transposase
MSDERQAKGLQIAKAKRVKKAAGKLWVVPSQSHAGTYVVDVRIGTCTCPDHETRAVKCKHLWAVEYVRHRVLNPDGTKVETSSLRVTYTQNWPAYNAAQCAEQAQVQELLRDLCEQIAQPPHRGRGRPPMLLSDAVYAMTMKIYSGVSGRRATTEIKECAAKGMIEQAPCYNSIFNYLDKPELTPLLTALIEQAAAPLRAVERDFAVDGTGFGTSVYRRWYDHKYGREMKEHAWIKAHAMVGVVTNVITSVRITDGDSHDAPQMPALVDATARTFEIRDVTADKAYLSHDNLAMIERVGGKPWIPFKSNSVDYGSPAWERLFHLFALHRPQFLEHYHQRSNAESTFSALKRKFGGSVRGKKPVAQTNEVLCKVLCYNLATLVHAMFELGIQPTFAPVG